MGKPWNVACRAVSCRIIKVSTKKKKKNCSKKNALNFVEEHVKPVQQHPQLSADVYFVLVEKQTVNQSHRKK